MATTVAWPADLPNCVQDWQEDNVSVVIRTEIDGGPPKTRRRYTKPLRNVQTTMILNEAQYKMLRDFFDSALQGGINFFTFTHPWSGEIWTMRFKETPKFAPLGPTAVTASMIWEQLPS